MYSDFSCEGFRGLGHLAIPRLSPVTVVTGRNGVGKSSLLEALFLHACGPIAGSTALTVLRPTRGLAPVTQQSQGRLEDPWSPFFANDTAGAVATLSAHVDGLRRSVTLVSQRRMESAFALNDEPSRATSIASVGVDVTTREAGTADMTVHQRAVVDADGTLVRFSSTPEVGGAWYDARLVKGPGAVNIPEAFSDLRRQVRDGELVVALQAVDPRIRTVELLVADGGLALHARLDDDSLLPFSSLGDGAMQTATLLLSVSAARGGLVLIDEVERGLHYSTLPDLWRALVTSARSSGAQLVVTTHSDECIAGAVSALGDRPEDLTVVRLRRTRDDVPARAAAGTPIEAVTYSGTQARDAVDLAVEVR